MRILIVGLGSMGRRHLANLRILQPAAHVTVWHQHSKSRDAEAHPSAGDCAVYGLQEALDTEPDAALITCPASLHVGAGLALSREGVHLLIEKPLSNTLDGVDELIEVCRQRSLVLAVGYNFRFHRPLQVLRQALMEGWIGRPLVIHAEVGQYLPDWRPDQDYRRGVSARQELGGGAVLELSHELDYVRWLMGEVESVTARLGRLSDLEIGVEDTAAIILQFCNRAVGSVHLDMTQRPTTRSCRITGTEGTLAWDGIAHRADWYSVAEDRWLNLDRETPIDPNDMYLAELRHFFDCVRRNASPIVSGEDGRRVLEIALAAKRSSEEQKVVFV